jgi:hypothetical protein
MALKRLDPQDFVVSSDSISATLWSGGTPTLTTFFTSSTQEAGSSGDYYLNVYQTASTDANAAIQFAATYGNKDGSGSIYYNSAVNGISPTKTIYGQYRTLVLGDENSSFIFGNQTSSDFWALSIDRARYKEKLLPGSLTLKLSGSLGVISLTDDSQTVSSTTFTDAGRIYNLVSGAAGVVPTSTGGGTTSAGWSVNSGSYGWLLPDIGVILLNPVALTGSTTAGGIGLHVSRSNNVDCLNNRRIYQAISASTAATFKLNSQETISSDYIFVRARNAEFNYTENPSFISGSTGEVVSTTFILNPQTYVTTVGLYNDTNDLLAVAKLSRPLLKDFTKEALVRVKLDF